MPSVLKANKKSLAYVTLNAVKGFFKKLLVAEMVGFEPTSRD